MKLDKFKIISDLALFVKKEGNVNDAAKTALEMTCSYVGLQGASLYLWDNEQNVSLTVSYAESPTIQNKLSDLENNLYENLRKNQKLVSAYMSFGGEEPYHSFTLPLLFKKDVFGAVIGLQIGENSPLTEDLFLETLSAMLSLHYTAAQVHDSSGGSAELIEKERLNAVLETAVTVNHEVNNPLQAIIGNIQLLLMKKENFEENVVEKLKAIEQSAVKINNVTQKLMRMTSPKTIKYSDGTKMIDINDDTDTDS